MDSAMPASEGHQSSAPAATDHDATNPGASPEAIQADDFYSGAASRIQGFMASLAVAFSATAWWKFGRWSALGFALGCAIAYLNFHWLKRGVSGLADRVTNAGKAQSGSGIVARFMLRYVLLGAGAYVILTSFPASLRGLFAGLCLPVGAIACEAAYELYVAVFRGA
jgi:ATP synthase I subunit